MRGDLARRELIAFWVREGRVLAGLNVNAWDVTEQIEEVIKTSGGVDDGDCPSAEPQAPFRSTSRVSSSWP